MTRTSLAMLGLMFLAAGCFLAVDVGSNRQSVSNGSNGGSDAGAEVVWGPDATVPCGPACSPIAGGCSGDFTITTAQEWSTFAQLGCVHLNGNLDLNPTDMPAVSVDGLQTVSGHVFIRSFSLTTVSFPALTSLGGTLDIAFGSNLTSVSFPLATTTGSINLIANAKLATLDLPALTEVRGHFDLTANDALPTLSLPALTSAWGAGFGIRGAALSTVNLPALRTAMGTLSVGPTPSLTSLSLPALTSAGNLYVRETALTSLSLPALTRVTDAAIADNPQLRQCLVDALRLQVPAATFSSSNNSGVPNTCP